MKNKSLILMLAVIIIVGMLSCKSKNQINDAIIKVVFTNQQTAADLDSIKENQKLKDVIIVFNKTTFDSIGKLNFIDFNVSFKELKANSQTDINDSAKTGFIIDKDKNEIKVGSFSE
ncbi:MAG: hypothetical protein NTZ33_00795 [Bacteroidetes bacterium]|nr:hypothetical protein [Bacteroidota bacterium]